MTQVSIKYKDGYKYQLVEEYRVLVGIKPDGDIRNDYLDLLSTGELAIKKGYAWDGPSGPTIDTKNFMRASLVHDALYQMMREGEIDKDKWRKQADIELKRICLEDGMWAVRAWGAYLAVRQFAGKAASVDTRKAVIVAPK